MYGKESLKISCFAKINLFLNVVKKLKHFHQIESIFHSISLQDDLYLSLRQNSKDFRLIFLTGKKPIIKVKTPDYDLGEGNLLSVIFSYFKDHYSIPNITIKLRKNIPVGAGLGGGSSNAAGLIEGINQLFKLSLTIEEKVKIAKKFGKDIPFFLNGGLVMVEGIGEKIFPSQFSLQGYLLLVYPERFISTKNAYSQSLFIKKNDDYRKIKKILFNPQLEQQLDSHKVISKLIFNSLYNCFQKKSIQFYPELKKIYSIIKKKTKKVLLSGSGSSFFAQFDDIISLNNVYSELKKKWRYVYKVKLNDIGIKVKSK